MRFHQLKRRAFITLLGGAVAWPLAARAQQAKGSYRLGLVSFIPSGTPQHAAFFDELRKFGFEEGRNLAVDGFYALDRDEVLAKATELARAPGVDAIVASGGGVAVRAAQQATTSIPIIGLAEDMVGEGLVHSLAHPGNNTTGISILAADLDGKRLELLIELLPSARRLGILADPRIAAPAHLQALRDGAHARGIDLSVHIANQPEQIVPAIDAAHAAGVGGLNVLATSLFSINQMLIFERVATLRLPAIYQWPEMAKAGGLIAYGPSLNQMYRQLARLVAKVLRGARPADVPVEQPTQIDFVINLKTAKALNLTVPPTLLTRADEMIE
jgi:putative tryptophan/tyrosine transport system substrate-binding protein